jgi:hypothetical protein
MHHIKCQPNGFSRLFRYKNDNSQFHNEWDASLMPFRNSYVFVIFALLVKCIQTSDGLSETIFYVKLLLVWSTDHWHIVSLLLLIFELCPLTLFQLSWIVFNYSTINIYFFQWHLTLVISGSTSVNLYYLRGHVQFPTYLSLALFVCILEELGMDMNKIKKHRKLHESYISVPPPLEAPSLLRFRQD